MRIEHTSEAIRVTYKMCGGNCNAHTVIMCYIRGCGLVEDRRDKATGNQQCIFFLPVRLCFINVYTPTTLNLTVMQSVLPKPVLEDPLHILHMLYVQSNLVLAVSTNELMSRIRCVR